MCFRLPLDRGKQSFLETLQDEFQWYLSLLQKIDDNDFNILFKNEGSPKVKDLTKRKFITFITRIQHSLDHVVKAYYEGYPDKAYKKLENLLHRNKFVSMRQGARGSYANRYINESLGNFFKLDWKGNPVDLYRMRISKDPLTKEELFHVPFNMRERVATARFSISGFPCLYFGTSLRVCWNEIKRDLKVDERVYACRYQNKKSISLVNLTIPSECAETVLETNAYSAFCFLVTYPFYLSCLMKVAHPDFSFKPEYIIPQLLLQYIKKEGMLDGIIYSSTKDRKLVGEKYYNIVIPARKMATTGHCHVAKACFHTTKSILVDQKKLDFSENELNLLSISELV